LVTKNDCCKVAYFDTTRSFDGISSQENINNIENRHYE
jgi:hypothetical protein